MLHSRKTWCKDDVNSKKSQTLVRTAYSCRLRAIRLTSAYDFRFLLSQEPTGFSITTGLRTERRVKTLPLYSFFNDLYDRLHKSDHRSESLLERRQYLLSVARKVLSQAFQAGRASPDDVDAQGRTLLHVSILCPRYRA